MAVSRPTLSCAINRWHFYIRVPKDFSAKEICPDPDVEEGESSRLRLAQPQLTRNPEHRTEVS